MVKRRVLMLITTFLVLAVFGTIAIFYARGWRLDDETLTIAPKGILVVNSEPNGAQVIIDGELETATNNTITLSPSSHDVVIRKEGYIPWQKRLIIEAEVVTQVDAFLVPVAPSLTAFTFSGVINPALSPDKTKIAYVVPPAPETNREAKSGLWIIETANFPLGFSREPRNITDGDLVEADWEWSPDSREILLTTKLGVFLLNTSQFTPQNQRINIASQVKNILAEWEKESEKRLKAQLAALPDELNTILRRKAEKISFSPDDTKILYTATANATIPEKLIKPLPGASTQQQKRDIKQGETYVYDIKEDRNFLVSEEDKTVYWLGNSLNILLPQEENLIISDYDGTNKQTAFSGKYTFPHAFPSPNTDRLLVLTNLGASDSSDNLYWLSLK